MEIWWMINKQSHFQTVKKNNMNANRTTTKKWRRKKRTQTNKTNENLLKLTNCLNLQRGTWNDHHMRNVIISRLICRKYMLILSNLLFDFMFLEREIPFDFFLLIFFAHFFPNLMRFFFQIWIKFAKWSKNVRIFFSANLLSLSK